MKIIQFLILFLSIFLGIGGTTAQGEILASVNYFQYSLMQQNKGEPQQETLLTSYAANLQFFVYGRYLLGASYISDSTSSSGVRTKREILSPSLGFFVGPLLIEGGPISKSIDKQDLNTQTEWRDGIGYTAAVTIYDRWGNSMLVGFQFTFLDIEYRKYFDGVNELSDQSRKVSVLNPSLRLGFVF